MPWFSYHGGHSGQFCRHAKGDLERVVARAVEAGFTHYGLSEHSPRYRPIDLFPGEEDLTPDDLVHIFEAYQSRAHELRAQYAGKLDLLIGFETERLPPDCWAQRMRDLRAQFTPDYIVGSVHDVDGHVIDFSPEQTARVAEAIGGVELLQKKYFDAVKDLVTQLRPEVVGHIDLIRKFDGPTPSFSPAVYKHIDGALEAVRSVGGDDSHGAHDVGVGLDASMRAIAGAGYTEVHYLAKPDQQVSLRKAPIGDVRPATV
jgi:histidinol-phosphatase (PHP family)